MAEKSMDQLHALLKSYEERNAKLQGNVKPVRHENEQQRKACGERLKGVVRTVLERFMDALKNAGHEAAIEDRTDSADAYPSVTLAFTPRISSGAALRSQLVFRYDPRRGIAVARDIKPLPAKGRTVTSSTDRIGTMRVDAVTVDWVETKTLSFIEAVLKVN